MGNEIQNARLQGIAVALAELARDHMELNLAAKMAESLGVTCPDLAIMVMKNLGLTLKDFENAGVEEYDLTALKEVLDFPRAASSLKRCSL